MKIAMTGATSMIGVALIKNCIDKDIEVLAFANPGSKRLDIIPRDEHVRIVECALDELKNYDPIDEKCDYFFHIAWAATTHAGRNDVKAHIDNIEYTIDAINLASKLKCKKFIGTGSQAEYGRVNVPLASDTPVNPEVPYGVAKLAAGGMSRIRANQLEMEHNWVRILSSYGPNDTQQTLMSSLLRSLMAGKHFATSEGIQIWDFIHCDDVAKALLLVAQKGKNGKVYPIGSGVGRPLREFIEEVCTLVDERKGNPKGTTLKNVGFGEVKYGQLQIMHLVADISELTEDTGFVPQISFESGVRAMIN
ncbi:MAG: NAD(P)-dependent oxidoreductase [Lachnospiraceae bacterium]|nr:NAD(P)-dependent oxidoreductase [Lachnospiraceae bacterium]